MEKENKVFILDGAMGTSLQALGMATGQVPELLNVEKPDMVKTVHRSYIEAGSDIIYTCTFGANRKKLAGYDTSEIIKAACLNAKEAAQGSQVKLALDIGPIGELLEPMGTLTFEEAYDIFKEIIEAGRDYVDYIVIETMTDLYEVKAAVLAGRESSDLPILASMSFEEDGRTFAGVSIEAFANAIGGLGVEALGINCSLGPVQMQGLASRLAEITDRNLLIKPNAGLPNADGSYDLTSQAFIQAMETFYDLGFKYLGGCCGTGPDHIKGLVDIYKETPVKARDYQVLTGPSSSTKVLDNTSFKIVGERLNPTGKKDFQRALEDEDMAYLISQGIDQVDAGAHILDVNVGHPGIDENHMQGMAIKALQSVLDIPLQIDTSKPEALEAGLRVYNGKAIVNSVNGEEGQLNSILPLVKKYNAQVIGLVLDEKGIPESVDERLAIAKKIMDRALDYGIMKEDIYIDCLTLTVSSQPEGAIQTLETMKAVKEELGLKTCLGVSNISFGLPKRDLINQAFLILAMDAGLDLAIINPNSQVMMEAILAYRALANEKGAIEDYIAGVSGQDLDPQARSSPKGDLTIAEAVYKGMEDAVADLVEEELRSREELAIVDEDLIPALDQVGIDYQEGELFLPQLIKSAEAAQAGFAVINKSIAKKGRDTISKGEVIVATVKGDVHDIGKNIAKVIMENYGYKVIDLGRDVEIEKIIQTAKERNIKLIGLSALMTTTLDNMEKTIVEIKKEIPDAKIMVGGAVLTPDYAMEIGADYYLKDAKDNVEVARKVFGE